MRRSTIRTWLQNAALLVGFWVGASGCGHEGFAVVKVSGTDDRVELLELKATVADLRANEVYPGHPEAVSFFLPEGSLGAQLTVTVNAWSGPCILASGSANGAVEDRLRLDLAVTLEPVASCHP